MRKKTAGVGTEEKILLAAFKEFSQHGYEGSRVDRIATRAKVNKAMIYYHFKGKDALYERVLSDIYGRILATVQGAPLEGENAREKIYSLIRRYIVFIHSVEDDVIRIMIREIASGGTFFKRLAIPQLLQPTVGIVLPLFNEARKEGLIVDTNLQMTFVQIIGSIIFYRILRIPMEGTPMQAILYPQGYIDAFVTNFLAIISHGVNSER